MEELICLNDSNQAGNRHVRVHVLQRGLDGTLSLRSVLLGLTFLCLLAALVWESIGLAANTLRSTSPILPVV